jgi:signal transduction protein with GAF and PtsI domain
MDQGIAGLVATTGQRLNIPDAYENPNFNQTIDKKTGYRTKAILCMPIKSEDKVIGVLQLINKVSGSGFFTEDDEDVMSIFLAIAGPILAESNLYDQIQGKSKGKGVEGVGGEVETMKGDGHGGVERASTKKTLPGMTEEEGDED